MSSGASKGNPVKGVSNKAKPNKSDSKTDKADLNPKIQPTAEQMQIARIMDSHRAEDPELQKKIKQVMEITRATEDEACMALHSREYDTAQAITLLTDGSGQLLSSEWEQAGKKKKSKTPASKNELPPREKERGPKEGGRDRSEKRDARSDKSERERKDSEAGDGQDVGIEQRRNDRGDKGDRGARGGSRRGGRGRGGGRADNKENDEERSRNFGGYGGRISNGPGRGGRGGGRGSRGSREGTRTFASRTRGREDDSGYHPIDVWENSQADAPAEKPPLKVDKWDEFPSAEDWDNEEYTGSLQETKVFTPSTQTQITPPLGDTTNGVGPNHLGSSASPAVVGDVKISSVGSGDALGDGVAVVTGLNNVAAVPPSVVPGQSIDLSLLLQQKPQNSSNSTVSNAGANLLATLQSSYSNANQVPIGNTNQALPPRLKVQRPRGPTTKIPSSAVEMPVDSVGTLDVQFGGLEFDDNSSMNFNPVLHGGPGGKPSADILYGAPPTKLDSFSAAEKDPLANKAAPPQAPSPFQNQRPPPQSTLVESVSSAAGVAISPIIDSHALSSLQNQNKNNNSPQSSYVNSSNVGSAFVSYGKGAPGFPAPGFAPVTQTPSGTVTYSNSTAGNGSSPPGAVTATPYTSSTAQSNYHNIGNLAYGSQPVVSAVQSSQIQSQPILPPVSQSPSAYSGNASQSSAAYHHNANSNTPAYGSTPSGTNQYGNYGPKLQGSLSAQNVTSGHPTVKDSPSENNSSVPASGSSSANSVQMGALQQGSASNVANASGGAKMGIPPGMVMQPQYILNHQTGMPTFYSLQAPFYGFDESSMQLLPRLPPHMQGYYDAGGANYGNPMSFALEANAGGPGVSGRNDGTTLPSFAGGSDARFPRSDSSTASPVPSNIAGQNTQQPIYNPGLPGYYFVGNMHPGTPFPYAPPPHMYPTTAMATPTNASGPPHAASTNHQYQNKGVYTPSYSYEGQGPSTDFGKNSYAGGSGVGPNSNSGKTSSATSSGNSQTTDLNSSMYGKGHMNKMNQYSDKPYTNSGGGYNSSLGAGSNPLNSQLSGAGMGTPSVYSGVYIAPQPVQALPLPQDGPRQGSGQPKGSKQYGAAPYWAN
ncbi:unnamed protein product [Allacma fusca]|uniref:Uncharacterized protein n=1 Tax=Allacma fusca TaxID=39272 RepID=A0A8J2J406_9HEXA|nr:unnamed protein product [Allacma fusca]